MPVKRIVLVVATAATAVLVGRKIASARRPKLANAGRWRVVTVYRDDVSSLPLPQPLLELGDLIEVRVSIAPGGKGSELAARLRQGEPTGASATAKRAVGSDLRLVVRRALRESKQLLETGEIIRLDPKPEGRRKRTPGGALIDLVSERSMGEGVL